MLIRNPHVGRLLFSANWLLDQAKVSQRERKNGAIYNLAKGRGAAGGASRRPDNISCRPLRAELPALVMPPSLPPG